MTTESLLVNVARRFVERWQAMADREGVTLSDWVAVACNAAEHGVAPDECSHLECNYGRTQCLRCGVDLRPLREIWNERYTAFVRNWQFLSERCAPPDESEPSAADRIDEVDGEVDDLVIRGGVVRLERMDDNTYWLCVYKHDGTRVDIDIVGTGAQRISAVLRR